MEHRTKEFCQQCIRELLSRYESLNTERAETELLFDDERMRYMAVSVGWMKHKRIHLCLVHIDIWDDLVIIQCNNTEDMILTELVGMGIPRDKICLGFVPKPYGYSDAHIDNTGIPTGYIPMGQGPEQNISHISPL